jgi:hypothetical protein
VPEHKEEPTTPDRDFSIIWSNLPLPKWLYTRLEEEKERVIREEGIVQHTVARQLAKANIENQLSEEEYQAALAEGQRRQRLREEGGGLILRPQMRDAVEADPVSPAEPD